jgi:hypothetical protein
MANPNERRAVTGHGTARGVQPDPWPRQTWRRLKGENQLPKVVAGITLPKRRRADRYAKKPERLVYQGSRIAPPRGVVAPLRLQKISCHAARSTTASAAGSTTAPWRGCTQALYVRCREQGIGRPARRRQSSVARATMPMPHSALIPEASARARRDAVLQAQIRRVFEANFGV